MQKRHQIDQLTHRHIVDVWHRHRGVLWWQRRIQRQLLAVLFRDDVIWVDNRCHEVPIATDGNDLSTQLQLNGTRACICRQIDTGYAMTLVTLMIDKGLFPPKNIALLDGKGWVVRASRHEGR